MPITFQSKLARSKKYRADIDGLRAIAVLPVVFYHANIGGFSGGYVGVDVFYVISGYLITSLIAKDAEIGKFSFMSFYERRIRRIFPALFGVMLFCAAVAAVLLTPADFAAFGKSMVAMTFFASNVLFKREGSGGYFGDASQRQVLLHTWSLSVEEQFYLFFPALLLLLMRWTKQWTAKVIFAITIVSFTISIWAVQHHPVAAFYIFIPRAWELLIGALLALRFVPPLQRRFLRELAGVCGLALIGWAVFSFTDLTAFPGVYALLPCLGAWLIIYAGESGPSYVKSVLSFAPLVFIGVISYSLYLWHWPLIMFSRYFAAGSLSGTAKWLIVACSVVVAFISFEFIEAPFRGGDSPLNRRQIFLFGASVSSVSAAIGLAVFLSHGMPWRYTPATRQLITENQAQTGDYDDVCGNWRKQIHNVSDIDFCTFGPASSKKIMFWGDSHVQQLYPVVKELYDGGELQGRGVIMALSNGCPPSEHLNTRFGGLYHCNSFTRFALERAEEPDVDTVYIGFATWFTFEQDLCVSASDECIESISPSEAQRLFLAELADHIRTLKAERKRVIVGLPFPLYDKSIPDLEIRNAIFDRFGLGAQAKDLDLPATREQLVSVARATGADLFDPDESLCDARGCITQLKGVSIYRDSNHLAITGAMLLRNNLLHVLQLPSLRTASSFATVPVSDSRKHLPRWFGKDD
jgi:peptidoglycan/LPS O-acetylase OafA/YrhL